MPSPLHILELRRRRNRRIGPKKPKPAMRHVTQETCLRKAKKGKDTQLLLDGHHIELIDDDWLMMNDDDEQECAQNAREGAPEGLPQGTEAGALGPRRPGQEATELMWQNKRHVLREETRRDVAYLPPTYSHAHTYYIVRACHCLGVRSRSRLRVRHRLGHVSQPMPRPGARPGQPVLNEWMNEWI